jgi:putative flavoprotein involved in K+ transport
MPLPNRIETAIVGAGQAGLALSYYLGEAGREHVLLERRSTLGGGWQDRWDEFCLVTPNWASAMPGFPYDGNDPDGFMPRDEIVARIARYADVVRAPVVRGADVRRVRREGERFRLETTAGDLVADRVVLAAGNFNKPRVPPIGASLSPRVAQLHTHDYRNESGLPPGGVLVVGSAQSGVQIAEELHDAGRPVFLSVGSAGWMPRRYRGRDIFRWFFGMAADGSRVGVPFPTVDTLPDPRIRLAGNPQLTGHAGGRDVDLRRLASEGMTLVGRLERAEGERVTFAPGIGQALVRSEAFFGERFRDLIDRFISAAGIEAPADDWGGRTTFEPADRTELDLSDAGVSTVIWASGYRPTFGWIDELPIDDQGLPRQRRGVTDVPGLYVLGLLWQHTQASATLYGPTQDAAVLASAMGVAIRSEDCAPA